MTGAVAPEHSRTRCRNAGQPSGSATSRYPRPPVAFAAARLRNRPGNALPTPTSACPTVLPEVADSHSLIMRLLFHDSADTTRFIECCMDESWIEHLRQVDRYRSSRAAARYKEILAHRRFPLRRKLEFQLRKRVAAVHDAREPKPLRAA